MNKDTRVGGFIIKVIVVVVGVCLSFIVLSVLASKTSLSTLGPSSSLTGVLTRNSSQAIDTRVNPLLDFGNNYSNSINDTSRSVPNTDGKGSSVYSGRISISVGNVNTIQPNEEYVTLRNRGAGSVNITGWALVNGKGSRPMQNSNNSYFYPTPDTAIIGQGTEFLDPSGRFSVGSIILAAGDTAYVTTGGPFSQFPLSISTSFRENICMGYLENYPFTPSINRSCPSLTNDSGTRLLTDECYNYVSSLGSCPNPEKTNKKVYDNQPSHCKAFLTERIGYSACVAHNINMKGFSVNQWRIFLGKERKMWASRNETITLYDSGGRIVDQVTY